MHRSSCFWRPRRLARRKCFTCGQGANLLGAICQSARIRSTRVVEDGPQAIQRFKSVEAHSQCVNQARQPAARKRFRGFHIRSGAANAAKPLLKHVARYQEQGEEVEKRWNFLGHAGAVLFQSRPSVKQDMVKICSGFPGLCADDSRPAHHPRRTVASQ